MQIGIDIVKSLKEEKWYELEGGGAVKIRPYPASKEVFLLNRDGDIKMLGENQKQKFMYCLTGWRDISDGKGSPVGFSAKIKEQIFEWHTHDEGMLLLVNEVLRLVAELKKAKEEDEEN